MSKKPVGYVVYCHEHLRDGHEEWARCFEELEHAMGYINGLMSRGPWSETIDVKLFTLGKQIPLEADDVAVPQEPKVTKRFKVKK